MYEAYWQLDARPFEHPLDPRFCFAAETQRGALLKLRYVIEHRRGAAVLAGETGLGKTLVAQTLLSELPPAFAPRVHLVFPQMPVEQLLAYLSEQLAGAPAGAAPTVEQSVRRLERTLGDNAAAGRHAVVVIDEAHLLRDSGALDAIRLLMNFQHRGEPLAFFLLVGQTPLVLAARRNAALDERLAVTCVLNRLSERETTAYIQHRLSAAGAKRAIFEASALRAIYELTHGIPRRVNRLCDLALLVGYGEELPAITGSHIESIHAELIGVPAAA